ncbi:MAG: hypothetical protein WD274_03420 [Acidimicrobiia bacterium]
MRIEASDRPTRPVLGIAISLGLLAIIGLAEVASDQEGESDIGITVSVVLVVLIAGFLVAKRPDHPVSWLMALTALLGAVAGVAADTLPPGIAELAWWQVPLAIVSGPSWFGLLLTVMVLIPLLFPTGSPPTPRWRWVARLSVAAVLLMTVAWTFQEEFCTDWGDDDEGCLATVANPIGISGLANPEESIVGVLAYGLLLLCSLAAFASLVVRYRRSTRVERSQIKWVLLSFGVFVLGFVGFDVIWVEMLGRPEPSGVVATVVEQIMWVLIPASIALAILRYRLYEIDRIISRTLSYALILGLLGLVALGLVSGFAFFLPNDDPLVVAISTLVVAALFNPLRKRVQQTVDRRFNRSRFDAERVVQGFASTLQERVDPEGVVDGWLGVVSETMQPAAVGVWVRESGHHVDIP